jgi:VWFA-related protein
LNTTQQFSFSTTQTENPNNTSSGNILASTLLGLPSSYAGNLPSYSEDDFSLQMWSGFKPMRISGSLSLLSSLLLVLCASSFVQDATAQQTGSPQIRVTSQLVVLDTIVTDRKGNVVTNLTKDDFTVYENGVPQTIRNFTAPVDVSPVPDAPIKDHNGNDNWGAAPLTMIVVDEMDTPFSELASARDCVRQYLQAQPDQLPDPTLLLWLNDDGFHALTPFTRDRQAILRALAHQPPSLASKLARGAQAEQIAASFAALQQAALFSRGQPGKKQIIWVGRSFPSIDPIGLDDYQRTILTKGVRSTVDLLLASRVSLYVIDPTITGSASEDDQPQEVDILTPTPATTVADPFCRQLQHQPFRCRDRRQVLPRLQRPRQADQPERPARDRLLHAHLRPHQAHRRRRLSPDQHPPAQSEPPRTDQEGLLSRGRAVAGTRDQTHSQTRQLRASLRSL